jgi:hypothetical protein
VPIDLSIWIARQQVQSYRDYRSEQARSTA